jgi:S-adenosylmethionine:tRNA ribosyltransferase-isomerase
LIAQEPPEQRDQSRLLVVDRQTQSFEDSVFDRLPDFLRPGDLVVLNNTRVFPARLIGRRVRVTPKAETVLGGRVEIFLVRAIEPLLWEALVRPGRLLLKGARVEFARGKLSAEIVEWQEDGRRIVRFEPEGNFEEIIDRIGRTPLPPYIKRDEEDRLDADRYQTVFATSRGAVAAPTAGLHFTRTLISRLHQRGVECVELTLHVGYGTFKPVRTEQVEDHTIESESYSIDAECARAINSALDESRRVIAVGTTTTRALESACDIPAAGKPPRIRAVSSGETALFIYPGFEFKVVRGLITNFHLPQSSLLMLVAAFAGRELILDSYRHAIARGYRFYSYGDAMLIL